MSQIGSEPTAKMNYDHPRRFLSPHPASRKRKERESVLQIKPPLPTAPLPSSSPSPARTAATKSDVDHPACSNRLLAGYMAHEFLTNGTLLGQKWDPARAEAVPLSGGRGSSEKEPSRKMKLNENAQSYADVAKLLMKGEEAHVAGVVNPSQLARWIQM